MSKTRQDVPMGFTHEPFPAGTHMCLIYSSDAERRSIMSKFLDSGLGNGEKVAYFADMMTIEEVNDWLRTEGVELPDGSEPEKFMISEAVKVYCPEGKFVPDDMLDTLRTFYGSSMKEEYTCVRVSGEMTWALKGIPGSDRLMEYEALVNNVVVTHPVTAVCQYDANKFDGGTILDVLKVHPMMIVHGQVVRNPYYLKPEDFLSEFSRRS